MLVFDKSLFCNGIVYIDKNTTYFTIYKCKVKYC